MCAIFSVCFRRWDEKERKKKCVPQKEAKRVFINLNKIKPRGKRVCGTSKQRWVHSS